MVVAKKIHDVINVDYYHNKDSNVKNSEKSSGRDRSFDDSDKKSSIGICLKMVKMRKELKFYHSS